MKTRRTFLTLSAAAALTACASDSHVPVPANTTLIILRHADRDGEDLSAKGIERAEALVAVLKGTHIDAIYSPGIQRNLDTAAPLAKARGITIQRIPAENPAAKIMAEGAGKTVVWVGNKGNLNSIWDALHAPGEPPLNYGDLFTVTRARIGSPLVTRARFGPEA